MARLKRGAIPGIRHHKPSGKAVVTLSGQDFYLATWGTKAALAEYDRVVNEWLTRGRRPLVADAEREGEITLVELSVRYKAFAKNYYRKNGKVTNEHTAIVNAAKVACGSYGREPASDFGPLKLQAVQQAMIRLGWSRKQINKQCGRIVRMFSWGVSQELVPAGVAAALREVKGLHKGRTEARETGPVLPVDESTVNATLEHVPPIVADMVRLQRLTGCRPEEICLIRPCDVDTSGAVWSYRPESHKTVHHGRERVIFIVSLAGSVCRWAAMLGAASAVLMRVLGLGGSSSRMMRRISSRRNKAMLIAASLVAAGLLLGLVGTTWQVVVHVVSTHFLDSCSK